MSSMDTQRTAGSRGGEPLGQMAVTLSAYISSYRGRRVPLEDLREQAYITNPTLIGDPNSRIRLRDAIEELATAGQAILPAHGSKTAWDTSMFPHLPAWVLKPAPTKPAAVDTRRPVYPSRLETAAALVTRPDEVELLNRVADWLRDHPTAIPVPMEERSLDLFGNEKILGERMETRLFTSGALTLDLLACHRTPIPLPSQHIPGTGATRLLVCENRAAYYSIVTACRALPVDARPDLHVAFGGGNQFSVGHAEIAFLDPKPVRALYCGDLDLAGIEIAVRVAAATTGTVVLEPAVDHYDWMLRQGKQQTDPSSRRIGDLEHLLAWFPVSLRPGIRELLVSRTKISQETVGLEALSRNSHLIMNL
ncbi:hypothetical protein QFZ35_003867 [Arthrobacter ulcerisalmonis]|nr:hypothetical protein [Arthrobacter ulcerisalmonis]MDQ0665369.1 hypothetical protein [Arthrobacter ulcerisalmonis]